jgi:hypothetical protein
MLRNERYFGNSYRSFTLRVELDESACESRGRQLRHRGSGAVSIVGAH